MSFIIKNVTIINENKKFNADVLLKNGRIEKISNNISTSQNTKEINAEGKYLFPGLIDDQVHFREPGLTHKGNIFSESKSAIAGGVTSFIEMPNTIPQTITQNLLEEKFVLGKKKSLANFSFMLGATNNNLEEILKINPKITPAVKIFMGSSTGNMLVDDDEVLEKIFINCPIMIATHCEDENIIIENLNHYKNIYGDDIPIKFHPAIRSHKACFLSSQKAINLGKKTNAKIHIFHISTADEIEFFDNSIPLKDKKITSEVCIHHLWFDDTFYKEKGNLIKWNPAIKTKNDREKLFDALINDKIDIIATDHAPHTLEEKNNNYINSPSGAPMVSHSLNVMLEFYNKNKISLEKIVEKMCHNPAILYQIDKRGFIREGYFADLVLVDLNQKYEVKKENILYKCGWSPLEGTIFDSKITHTFVNGNLVFDNGNINESFRGEKLLFNR